VVTRLGAFDRALSTLPIFLFVFGIAIWVTGVVLRFYEPAFIGSPEFLDISLLAIVLVAASAGVYVAEIRTREAATATRMRYWPRARLWRSSPAHQRVLSLTVVPVPETKTRTLSDRGAATERCIAKAFRA
jgi:hypothetical protein